MALRSKRPCRQPGCPALVDGGYCTNHKQQERISDWARGTPAERGYDHAWRRVRVLALKRDKYLCLHCLAVGRVTSAMDVDHIKPLAEDGERLNIANLQSLCRPCHNRKTYHS